MVVAEDVFGKDLSHLKGKTTRRTPKAIVNDTNAVPRELRNRKDIVLHIDNIYTNGIPFVTSIGYPLHSECAAACRAQCMKNITRC